MVEARTLAEAYAYFELTAPPGEEALDVRRYTTLERREDGYLLRFDGPYQGEWFTAEVTVPLRPAVSQAATAGEQDAPLSYGDGPSQLIDAGQWYALEQGYAGMAEAGQNAGDPGDYFGVAEAWEAAGAAVAEIEKFLPSGAAEVPDAAFWTGQGRSVRSRAAPGSFGRNRLAAARARYAQALAELTRDTPPEPDGSGLAGSEIDPPEEEPRPTEPLPARSYAEVHAYLDLHPCVCGSAQFPRENMAVSRADDTGVVVEYTGLCDQCARKRWFTFWLPPRPGLPPGSPYSFSYPEDGPSRLLDAAQWLDISEGYAFVCDVAISQATAPGAFDAATDRDDMEKYLTGAASAVDEVLKFLPPGADSVPAGAFWSEPGRARYAAAPEQFDRPRLAERREQRWRLLAEFVQRYPVGS